jgi:hypothetical protein
MHESKVSNISRGYVQRAHVQAYLFNENTPKTMSDQNQRSLWLLVINQQHRSDLRYNLLSNLTTEKAQALQQRISLMDESFFIGPKGWTRLIRV